MRCRYYDPATGDCLDVEIRRASQQQEQRKQEEERRRQEEEERRRREEEERRRREEEERRRREEEERRRQEEERRRQEEERRRQIERRVEEVRRAEEGVAQPVRPRGGSPVYDVDGGVVAHRPATRPSDSQAVTQTQQRAEPQESGQQIRLRPVDYVLQQSQLDRRPVDYVVGQQATAPQQGQPALRPVDRVVEQQQETATERREERRRQIEWRLEEIRQAEEGVSQPRRSYAVSEDRARELLQLTPKGVQVGAQPTQPESPQLARPPDTVVPMAREDVERAQRKEEREERREPDVLGDLSKALQNAGGAVAAAVQGLVAGAQNVVNQVATGAQSLLSGQQQSQPALRPFDRLVEQQEQRRGGGGLLMVDASGQIHKTIQDTVLGGLQELGKVGLGWAQNVARNVQNVARNVVQNVQNVVNALTGQSPAATSPAVPPDTAQRMRFAKVGEDHDVETAVVGREWLEKEVKKAVEDVEKKREEYEQSKSKYEEVKKQIEALQRDPTYQQLKSLDEKVKSLKEGGLDDWLGQYNRRVEELNRQLEEERRRLLNLGDKAEKVIGELKSVDKDKLKAASEEWRAAVEATTRQMEDAERRKLRELLGDRADVALQIAAIRRESKDEEEYKRRVLELAKQRGLSVDEVNDVIRRYNQYVEWREGEWGRAQRELEDYRRRLAEKYGLDPLAYTAEALAQKYGLTPEEVRHIIQRHNETVEQLNALATSARDELEKLRRDFQQRFGISLEEYSRLAEQHRELYAKAQPTIRQLQELEQLGQALYEEAKGKYEEWEKARESRAPLLTAYSAAVQRLREGYQPLGEGAEQAIRVAGAARALEGTLLGALGGPVPLIGGFMRDIGLLPKVEIPQLQPVKEFAKGVAYGVASIGTGLGELVGAVPKGTTAGFEIWATGSAQEKVVTPTGWAIEAGGSALGLLEKDKRRANVAASIGASLVDIFTFVVPAAAGLAKAAGVGKTAAKVAEVTGVAERATPGVFKLVEKIPVEELKNVKTLEDLEWAVFKAQPSKAAFEGVLKVTERIPTEVKLARGEVPLVTSLKREGAVSLAAEAMEGKSTPLLKIARGPAKVAETFYVETSKVDEWLSKLPIPKIRLPWQRVNVVVEGRVEPAKPGALQGRPLLLPHDLGEAAAPKIRVKVTEPNLVTPEFVAEKSEELKYMYTPLNKKAPPVELERDSLKVPVGAKSPYEKPTPKVRVEVPEQAKLDLMRSEGLSDWAETAAGKYTPLVWSKPYKPIRPDFGEFFKIEVEPLARLKDIQLRLPEYFSLLAEHTHPGGLRVAGRWETPLLSTIGRGIRQLAEDVVEKIDEARDWLRYRRIAAELEEDVSRWAEALKGKHTPFDKTAKPGPDVFKVKLEPRLGKTGPKAGAPGEEAPKAAPKAEEPRPATPKAETPRTPEPRPAAPRAEGAKPETPSAGAPRGGGAGQVAELVERGEVRTAVKPPRVEVQLPKAVDAGFPLPIPNLGHLANVFNRLLGRGEQKTEEQRVTAVARVETGAQPAAETARGARTGELVYPEELPRVRDSGGYTAPAPPGLALRQEPSLGRGVVTPTRVELDMRVIRDVGVYPVPIPNVAVQQRGDVQVDTVETPGEAEEPVGKGETPSGTPAETPKVDVEPVPTVGEVPTTGTVPVPDFPTPLIPDVPPPPKAPNVSSPPAALPPLWWWPNLQQQLTSGGSGAKGERGRRQIFLLA